MGRGFNATRILLDTAERNLLDEEQVSRTVDHHNQFLQSIACSLLVIAKVLVDEIEPADGPPSREQRRSSNL